MAVLEDKGTCNEVAVEVYEEGEQEAWGYDANEMEFDDMGEGAGVKVTSMLRMIEDAVIQGYVTVNNTSILIACLLYLWVSSMLSNLGY